MNVYPRLRGAALSFTGCGDKLWIVEVVAPFGGTDEMLKDLKGKVFPHREVRFRAVEAGKPVARVL